MKVDYKMRISEFQDMVKTLHEKYEATPRQFVMHTGQAGYDTFNYQLEKQNNLDFTEFLYNDGVLNLEEKNALISMINSPDRENYEVAKVILQTKSDTNPKFHSTCQSPLKHITINTKA